MSDRRILIVEDDDAIAAGLALNLRLQDFQVEVVHDGEQGLERALTGAAQLVLLDIGLPNLDGLEVLRELRDRGVSTPVIVLSAREGEYDKVAALRLGADDYVTKPFALAELLARVEAVLRRAQPAVEPSVGFGDVEIRIDQRVVVRSGEDLKLTHLEFELLLYLVRRPNQVVSREELLREVWGVRSSNSRRTVDNFVGQLRHKVESDPEQPVHIQTVRGSGYRFCP